LEQSLLEAGIEALPGIAIEVGPLSGLDADEYTDMRPIAEELRAAIADHEPRLVLAPKLSITLDGGGRFHLGDVASDIKIAAFRDSGGQIRHLMSIGGDNRTACRLAILEERQIVSSIMALLAFMASRGPSTRGKELDAAMLADLFHPDASLVRVELPTQSPAPAGRVATGYAETVLGLVLPYCQIDSKSLATLADRLIELGAGELRFAPKHGFFVTGLEKEKVEDVAALATTLGFWLDPNDPRQSIALCVGARGCASAYYDTREIAESVLEHAPGLLDGSLTLHLSGCAKGCAHPSRSALALVGTPTGYGLVVNGAASSPPERYLVASELNSALEGLASLAMPSNETGHTVCDRLMKLGARRIAEALLLEKT
jgi:precorrin-3B synthase